MGYKMEFYLLTKKFYEKYSNCKEILKKENRPYTICIIEITEPLTTDTIRVLESRVFWHNS